MISSTLRMFLNQRWSVHYLRIGRLEYKMESKSIFGIQDVIKKLWSVMVKALDCEIVVREFEILSRYYVHIRRNTFGKSMNPLIHPSMG